jgi:hypothetical protein
LVPRRQSAFESSTLAQILVVAFAGADFVIEIPTGPLPSVMNVNVLALPLASVEASSSRLLKVTCAIWDLGGAVGVGPGVVIEDGPTEAVGPGEPAEAISDGSSLGAEESNGDGAGDPPDVASRAPAAMMSTTHAMPRMADRLRQLVSFT